MRKKMTVDDKEKDIWKALDALDEAIDKYIQEENKKKKFFEELPEELFEL